MDLILKGKAVISAVITTQTGMHIGGSSGGLEIGGVDNSVIKDHEGKPYIPGSSLKGKMRSLLEKSEGKAVVRELVWQKLPQGSTEGISIHVCNQEDCPICLIFGRNSGSYPSRDPQKDRIQINNVSPTRILVRDAYLIEESIPKEIQENLELPWTEVKYENSIDRITSAANPRQSERVPRGAQFKAEIVYTIYTDMDKELFYKVLKAMKLLEDDYLGGSGSRGYGQITFDDIKVFWNSHEDYEKGTVNLAEKEPLIEASNLTELYSRFVEKKEQLLPA